MEPGDFDTAAGVALLVGMPAAVLFAAAALRRTVSGRPRARRWVWALFAVAVVVVLVLLDRAGGVRYPTRPDAPTGPEDFGQFVGLGLGRVGVAVNGAVCVLVGLLRAPRPRTHPVVGREARLLSVAHLALAAGSALPAVWWCSGLGMPPVAVPLVPTLAGAALFVTVLVVRWRRLGSAFEDHDVALGSSWPLPTSIGVVLTSFVVVATASLGGGLPDPRLAPDKDADRHRPVPTTEPDWPGPTPSASTTLAGAAVRDGTRAALADTVRWAGPLDDLSAPTPARADAPPITLTEERCDAGVRWTGSLVLPSVTPQDVADRVQHGWERAGYAVVDVAMGTQRIMPVRGSLPVWTMRLGGGTDGVHVDVESFCVPR